jgi:hypothetical protein
MFGMAGFKEGAVLLTGLGFAVPEPTEIRDPVGPGVVLSTSCLSTISSHSIDGGVAESDRCIMCCPRCL